MFKIYTRSRLIVFIVSAFLSGFVTTLIVRVLGGSPTLSLIITMIFAIPVYVITDTIRFLISSRR